MLQPRLQHIFSSVSSLFSPGNESVSVDGFWDPLFLKFVCHCRIGTLCELLCEQLFFLFQQNSCFSLSFIDSEKIFALTHITYASVNDVKSKNSVADTPCIFPKILLTFVSPDYRSRNGKKGWNFFFSLKKIFFTKKKLLQNQSSTMFKGWERIFKRQRVSTTELQICAKKGDNSQVSWSERMTFS